MSTHAPMWGDHNISNRNGFSFRSKWLGQELASTLTYCRVHVYGCRLSNRKWFLSSGIHLG